VPAEDDAQLIEYVVAITGCKPPSHHPEGGGDIKKKLQKQGNLISPPLSAAVPSDNGCHLDNYQRS